MEDIVVVLRTTGQVLQDLEPWRENERQVGVLLEAAAREIEFLRRYGPQKEDAHVG